jgi:S-formylglutathione hydrolase FrmB
MRFRHAFAVVVAAAGAAAVVAGVGHARGSIHTEDHVVSTHAGSLGYEVFLPSDYETSGKRYPVLYFLHGLPAGAQAFRSFSWLGESLEQTGREAILVVPEAARDGDTDPEYLGAWEAAIASDIPRAVDARFRTIGSRDGRALIGLSAGGYGAMHLALAHLARFRAVESWSGYFHPTDPTGQQPLDLGSAPKNAAANVHLQFRVLRDRLRRLPLYVAFYVGRSDPTFVAENVRLNQELSAAGIPHVFRLYPGGHSQSLWAAQAPAWLTLALNHLAAAR